MASRDTTKAPSQGFEGKVLQVLRDPQSLPPEFAAWVRGQIVRNPLVKVEPYQLPTLDKKHVVGAAGEAPFQNSWVNFAAGYEQTFFYKDNASRVYLQGLIKSGTMGTAAFTLPVGYRPLGQIVFAVQSNGALGQVDVFGNGDVVVQAGSNVGVSLNGLSFRVL